MSADTHKPQPIVHMRLDEIGFRVYTLVLAE